MRRLKAGTAGIAVAALALTLAACGSDGGDSDGNTDTDTEGSSSGDLSAELTWWDTSDATNEAPAYDKLIEKFNEEYPDVTIKHETVPFDQTQNKFKTAAESGSGAPDILRAEVAWTPEFASLGYLYALDGTAALENNFLETPLSSNVYEDKTYGVPQVTDTLGLMYNKELFEKAGLDPEKPPATWDEVRTAAKKIAGLGGGTVGYADYSAQNQGGWHFTAELYSQGGDVVAPDGKKATVDSPEGRAVLRTLHDMRWKDDSMGSKQLLVINDVQQMMGSGKLGMYLAAPDNIPILVKEKGGNYKDLALAPMPGGKGTLIGGDGYMFNKKASPEQIRAGLKWLDHMFLTPGDGFLGDYARAKKNDAPVGLPEPRLFTGAADTKDQEVKKANANVPVENYQAFLDGNQNLDMKIEPPSAQQIYSVLDGVVSAVLTKEDADIDQLLKDASGKIDGILDRG